MAAPAWARWELVLKKIVNTVDKKATIIKYLVDVRAPPLLTDWWEVTAGAALARPSRAKHTKAC